jgi:alpha-L-fucosidase
MRTVTAHRSAEAQLPCDARAWRGVALLAPLPQRARDPAAWRRFTDVMFAQITELLTNYGELHELWLDGGWERTPEQWRSAELLSLVRRLQPRMRVNDRLPGIRGDFATPEQQLPVPVPMPVSASENFSASGGADAALAAVTASAADTATMLSTCDGATDAAAGAASLPWEMCETMGDFWSFVPRDMDALKSTQQLVTTVCEVASRGGSLLLNVGPRADGSLHPAQLQRLLDLQRWMTVAGNARSVVGTGPGLQSWQFYGPSTLSACGRRVFLHLVMQPRGHVVVRGLRLHRIARVTELRTGQALRFGGRATAVTKWLGPDADVDVDITIAVPQEVLDPVVTVIVIDLDDAPGPRYMTSVVTQSRHRPPNCRAEKMVTTWAPVASSAANFCYRYILMRWGLHGG